MLLPLESSSTVLVIISSKSVSVCNRSHAIRANSGKITIYSGVPLFDALVSFEGNLLTQRHQICYRLSYGRNAESLSHVGLSWYRVVTDGQTDARTDRITIASTRLALRAVARKKSVNIR